MEELLPEIIITVCLVWGLCCLVDMLTAKKKPIEEKGCWGPHNTSDKSKWDPVLFPQPPAKVIAPPPPPPTVEEELEQDSQKAITAVAEFNLTIQAFEPFIPEEDQQRYATEFAKETLRLTAQNMLRRISNREVEFELPLPKLPPLPPRVETVPLPPPKPEPVNDDLVIGD